MRKLIPILVIVPIVVAIMAGLLIAPHGSRTHAQLIGTSLRGRTASGFTLRDQFGHTVQLAQFRGQPVVLTFVHSRCREACPVIAEELRRTLDLLKRHARQVAVVAISTYPEEDTRTSVIRFSRTHGLLHRWHYLTGPRNNLTRIWRRYGIFAPPAGSSPSLADMHTTATYLIDQRGRERELLTGNLDSALLTRDLRILLKLPVDTLGRDAVPAPEVGHPAPNFTLRSVSGSSTELRSFKGKVVLLNFWATWCIPCRKEMPLLARWYRQAHARGFVILGVDRQEPANDVRAFLHELTIPYPVVLDGNGSIVALYHVIPIPASFLIDRQGVIQSVQLGQLDDIFFPTKIAPLLTS